MPIARTQKDKTTLVVVGAGLLALIALGGDKKKSAASSSSDDATKPPTPSTTPTPAPKPQPAPTPGNSAKALATQLASNVAAKKYSYDRNLCKRFQAAATGLKVDGIYGGATYNALRFYGVASPPRNLFKPSPSTSPYKPAA